MNNFGRIRGAQIHNQVCRSGLDKAAYLLTRALHIVWVDHRLNRTLNCARVATNGGAVLLEDRALVLEVLQIGAYAVPDIGVLRDDAQRELLAAAPNHKGRSWLLDGLWLAVRVLDLVIASLERGSPLGPHAFNDFASLTQTPDALAWLIEGNAVGAVLGLVPASADAEIQATTRNNIDVRADIRQDCGMAISIACDHQSHAHPVGQRRERAEQRPALVAWAARIAIDRHEMVKEPGMLDGRDSISLQPNSLHVL